MMPEIQWMPPAPKLFRPHVELALRELEMRARSYRQNAEAEARRGNYYGAMTWDACAVPFEREAQNLRAISMPLMPGVVR